MNDPLVSVVVLVYNSGEHLLPCLQSVAAQSLPDFEAVVIDNGSTDGSGAVCDAFAAQDKRFRVIHQKNLGIIAGRGSGVARSRGEYVSFVDGDDLLHPRILEVLTAACRSTGLPAACCRFVAFWGRPPAPGTVPPPTTLAAPAHLNALLHDKRVDYSLCNKLYRRALLENEEFDCPVVYNEDLYLNWRLLQNAAGMAFVDFVGYFYRQHGASITHRPLRRQAIDDQLFVADTILDSARGGPLEDSAWAFYCEKLLYLDSMILRRADARKFWPDHHTLCRLLRGLMGRVLASPYLSPALKLAALLACHASPVYHALCRLLLTDRR